MENISGPQPASCVYEAGSKYGSPTERTDLHHAKEEDEDVEDTAGVDKARQQRHYR